VRYENGSLEVPDFQTLGFYGRLNNNSIGHIVKGGTRKFSKLVKSAGAVWRFAEGFSGFAGYSEGFGLPDVGILLRSTALPNQSVDSLVSLTPIVTKSMEAGLNWRGSWGSFGVSAYESKSKLGSTLRIGADGLGEVVRVPTRVRGIEAVAEVRPVKDIALFATYALTDGKTALAEGQPLDLALGGRSQGPNKLTAAVDWNFMPRANARLQAAHLFDRDVNVGRGRTLEEHFDGYTVADFSASVQTGDGSKIGIGVENIFNQHYIVYFSQTVRFSAADANGQYVAGHGRIYTLSFSQEF
jgi:iron complex outermembrane receptor protein